MSAPRERPATALTPEAMTLMDTYFSRVHGALLVAATGECRESVEDLREHVLEELEGSAGTVADVTRILADLGTPEALAAQCAAIADEEPAASDKRSLLSGRVLGIPYELRPPTAERVVLRWWDPLDRHVIVPRLFGIGWTVNFGALAVILGLVRPDDEDVPFGQVPARWLAASLVLPLLFAVGLAVLVALYQPGLPAQVATHYGPTGVPDGFSSKEVGLLLPAGMTVLGLALAASAWVRRRPPLSKVGAGALATMLAVVSLAIYAQSVATAHGATGMTILLTGVAGCFLLPFLLFVTLSRVGRAAEQRRDLEGTSMKGSAR